MKLGIFARTFSRPALEQVFDAVKEHGLDWIQFNFSSLGLPTLPERIEPDLLRRISRALTERSLKIAAVSGTCNLIHPDKRQREENLTCLQKLIAACPQPGTGIVTLCSGTRDPDDMWRAHRENDSPEAWRELQASLEFLLPMAERHKIVLGIEPEPANVINSARSAHKLLGEMKSPSLKIVFDAANLVAVEPLARQQAVLTEAYDLLGPQVVLAHAKDLRLSDSGKESPRYETVPAGKGQLDYECYLSILRNANFNGALVLHSLGENEVRDAVKFLQPKLTNPKAEHESAQVSGFDPARQKPQQI